MKKLSVLVFSVLAVIGLSGCGSGGGSDSPHAVDMNYLTDSFGAPVSGIGYDCLSGEHGVTDPTGGYYFDPYGDSCDFYLPQINDDLHIEDAYYNGVNGLLYDCTSGFIGFTGDYVGAGGYTGGFNHDWFVTDVCTIDY